MEAVSPQINGESVAYCGPESSFLFEWALIRTHDHICTAPNDKSVHFCTPHFARMTASLGNYFGGPLGPPQAIAIPTGVQREGAILTNPGVTARIGLVLHWRSRPLRSDCTRYPDRAFAV
jgi:hypothetical protein